MRTNVDSKELLWPTLIGLFSVHSIQILTLEVDVSSSNIKMIWTLSWKQYVVRFGSKKGHWNIHAFIVY